MSNVDVMLDLLRFAYLQSTGFWIVPYALTGLFLTCIAGIKVKGRSRLPCMAFILALFFSLSLAIGRTVVPLPTMFAVGLWAADIAQRAVHPPVCPPSSEGCMPLDEGSVLIVFPLLVQWLFFYVLLVAVNLGWRAIGQTSSNEAKNST